MFVFLALLFAMFYFLIIRPQRKKQKEHQGLLDSLKRGDKVITIGGIYGQVDTISEDSIVIKVESGATVRLLKGGIAAKQEPDAQVVS
jgi:preprotein translocase subunit YajC